MALYLPIDVVTGSSMDVDVAFDFLELSAYFARDAAVRTSDPANAASLGAAEDHVDLHSEMQEGEEEMGVALLRRRPRRLLRAARQELLDPSKAWWGGRRGRLADRRCCPISVSLGVVPLVLARFVEVPVRIEVAAGS